MVKLLLHLFPLISPTIFALHARREKLFSSCVGDFFFFLFYFFHRSLLCIYYFVYFDILDEKESEKDECEYGKQELFPHGSSEKKIERPTTQQKKKLK